MGLAIDQAGDNTEVTAAITNSRTLMTEPDEDGICRVEVRSGGKLLGNLKMVSIPVNGTRVCYLIYMEVRSRFQNHGLGGKVLEEFHRFLCENQVVGILDNIIDPSDPAGKIYENRGWVPLEPGSRLTARYMAFIPDGLDRDHLLGKIRGGMLDELDAVKEKFHLIENQRLVADRISELKREFEALKVRFSDEIKRKDWTAELKAEGFKFILEFIEFKRYIAGLMGYTGGDSLEAFDFNDWFLALPASPLESKTDGAKSKVVHDSSDFAMLLPENWKDDFAAYFSNLPNYRRPIFKKWLYDHSRRRTLRLWDLLVMGYDPTKLKEAVFGTGNGAFSVIIERIRPAEIAGIFSQMDTLRGIAAQYLPSLGVNLPFLIIRHGDWSYVFRKKVQAIHLSEALHQVCTMPHLEYQKDQLERAIKKAAADAKVQAGIDLSSQGIKLFIPWNPQTDAPDVEVGFDIKNPLIIGKIILM